MLRVLALVAGLGAFLALGIVGIGGFAVFIGHPALVALAVALVAVAVASYYAGGSLTAGVREDRANRWVLIPFGAIGLLLGVVPAWTDRLNVWSLDGETVRWIGVALFAAGCVLRILPVFQLGNRFSGLVAIQPGHELATTGWYAHIRNPSYLGLLIAMLGWALAFRSIAGIVLTALIVPPLVARINAEERLLREEFGQEYEAWAARTWRLIPGLY